MTHPDKAGSKGTMKHKKSATQEIKEMISLPGGYENLGNKLEKAGLKKKQVKDIKNVLKEAMKFFAN